VDGCNTKLPSHTYTVPVALCPKKKICPDFEPEVRSQYFDMYCSVVWYMNANGSDKYPASILGVKTPTEYRREVFMDLYILQQTVFFNFM
jgi:hypothetical protein